MIEASTTEDEFATVVDTEVSACESGYDAIDTVVMCGEVSEVAICWMLGSASVDT